MAATVVVVIVAAAAMLIAARDTGRVRDRIAALLTDIRLRLTPRAWAVLAQGDPDPRIATALEDLVAEHDIDVAALPRTAPEARVDAPTRSARVTAVDGDPVAINATGDSGMTSAVAELEASYRPHPITVERWRSLPALRFTFLAPTPLVSESRS